MATKLPVNAIEFYVGLGAARSYEAVAEHFGVSKRAVVNRAMRDGWQRKVSELEAKAKLSAEKRAVETLEEMNERHLKSLRVIQGRALEALRNMPLESAMDAVRALDIGIRQERIIRGEPADRTAISVEETIKREYSQWLELDEDAKDGETEK